jgi:glycerol-3-phosphate dehydrogenase (NAD(P)+)
LQASAFKWHPAKHDANCFSNLPHHHRTTHQHNTPHSSDQIASMVVGVIGGGAWGTALAIHAARMGHDVLLWALEPEVRRARVVTRHRARTHPEAESPRHAHTRAQVVDAVNGPARENTMFLKGHTCPPSLKATGDMAEVARACEAVLIVVPTPFVERTVARVASEFRPDTVLVSCTKGILNDSLETRECWRTGTVGAALVTAWLHEVPPPQRTQCAPGSARPTPLP